jgi:hypothetical protein
MTLVILTEEPSMKTTLEHVLCKLGIDLSGVRILAHQGKSDLEKSIPLKLKAWLDPEARFLILRDNDRGDCRLRKSNLLDIVAKTGRADKTLVRIVCQELEAWFLGDPLALEAAGYLKPGRRPAFCKRDPDTIDYPVEELKKLRAGYGKGTGAAAISPHLDLATNASASFRATVAAIERLVRQ